MGQKTLEQWSLDAAEQHIDVGELKGGNLGMQSLFNDMKDKPIML